MVDTCKLYEHEGTFGRHCEQEECIYWRAIGHLGLEGDGHGCAIKHFELLDGDPRIAAWLLSVKERVEARESKDE